ncbi:MAG: LLM class flavin-dependent oxidoreductase [Candidatus Heimdallarchaeum endolithica]|uniref:LLM class flavin-dependent oxidoreductase n=1 Tax=Candidatus Heimdallarchaeum endolithica TaxID=2876572 RepID=A0A9Y1BS49_9ARCH|nr:MAG: LLM class flavin-dependent oxidoreductase [Candidatus Heimdallarchaeum endolithica]
MSYYGVQIEPQFGYSFDQIKEIVQNAEKLGFTHAWFSDHFMLNADATNLESQECIIAMMAAASYTTKLRIGSLVLCNNYRYPSVLAKQIASLDNYSNGRIDFGFGAGWKELEYKAYGIPFPSVKERLGMLEEAIQIIRKLWAEDKVNFEGKYYHLKEAISFPKPVQKPMKIWVGTMYAKIKMLTLASKYADGINLAWAYPLEVFEEKMNLLDELCEKNDRKSDSLLRSYGIWTRIYESEEEKIKIWKEIAEKRGFTLEELEKRYEGAMHGTIEEITSKIKEYRKLGVSHFIFMFPGNQEIEQMKLFSKEILPKL